MQTMPVPVTLEDHEVQQAWLVASVRKLRSLQMKLQPAYGAEEKTAIEYEVQGACAELAVAKHTGLYWSGGVDTMDGPDVGRQFQVRWTADGRLLVRPENPSEYWYVLVTGRCPAMVIHGMIWGANAKRPEWLTHLGHPNRPLVHAVPSSMLQAVVSVAQRKAA